MNRHAEDFRAELIDALARELEWTGGTDGERRERLAHAVDAVTQNRKVEKSTVDRMPSHVDEVELAKRYTITTPPRPFTDAENAERDQRQARADWKHGPRRFKAVPPEGVTTLDLLEQRRWWITKEGERIRVKRMDPRHRFHTLAMLRRRASELHRADGTSVLLSGGGMFEPPDEVVDEVIREMEDPDAAKRWLERRPLVKKLRELVDEDGRSW